MKYKVGDRVRIKSIDWYNKNKDKNGVVLLTTQLFTPGMSQFCGKVMTIENVEDINNNVAYYMEEIDYDWTDEMIDCLVERNGKTYPYKIGDRVVLKGNNRCATITDLKYNSFGNLSYYIKIENDRHSIDYPTDLLLPYKEPKFKVGDILFYRGETSGYLKVEEIREENGEIRYYETSRNVYLVENDPDVFADKVCSVETEETKSEDELLDEYEELTDRAFKGGYEKCQSDIELNGFQLPEGYIFKDENGNIINATKIVLEKKKKEYPKTFVEVLDFWYPDRQLEDDYQRSYKKDLIKKFQDLLYARDAYWKIYGEEFNWDNALYYIYTNDYGNVIKSDDLTGRNCVLAFPDKASRDAFYENFKEEIEMCKELL